MKITIVNGISENDFKKESESIKMSFNQLSEENDVAQFDVDRLNIHHCTGCWTCWIKNPGNCVFNDDMVDIYKSIVKSDLLIFVSSIKAGFIQSEIKKVLDRMFALILPHMTILKDEFHHIPRYDNQPKMGLVIVGEDNHEQEQEEILKEFMYRLSLNFNKGTGNFLHYYNADNEKELLNEISSI